MTPARARSSGVTGARAASGGAAGTCSPQERELLASTEARKQHEQHIILITSIYGGMGALTGLVPGMSVRLRLLLAAWFLVEVVVLLLGLLLLHLRLRLRINLLLLHLLYVVDFLSFQLAGSISIT